MVSSLARFGLACLIALWMTAAAAPSTLVIADVTVINPRHHSMEANRNVVVRGGRITAVTAASAHLPGDARVVRGTGRYLIPGLWDAHVHLTKAGVLSLPLFVANGVTGVRDMGSDLSEVATWRRRIDAGELIGPRIKTPGQILESRSNVERMKRDGTVEPVDRIRVGVGDPDEARRAVNRLAAAGVDHIKMRTTPDLQTFLAAADQAKRHRLPLAVHPIASPDDLLRAGVRSVEHFLTYPPLNNLSDAGRRELFRKIAKAGMYMSNTMVNIDGLISTSYQEGKRIVSDTRGALDPRRKYVCGYLIDDWREQVEENKASPFEELRSELPDLNRDFKEMHEEGVPFLAGTDVGVVFMYPGFSLHDELETLVRDVGFTPMDALAVATDGVPGFYRETSRFGALEPGQSADLVLLDANPVTDIRNVKRIAAVALRGRWFDRADLDRLLAQVEQHAQTGCHEVTGP
ncbi:MAG TPA: amidohydrolase family protein [Vicinamibacterales bacterium]